MGGGDRLSPLSRTKDRPWSQAAGGMMSSVNRDSPNSCTRLRPLKNHMAPSRGGRAATPADERWHSTGGGVPILPPFVTRSSSSSSTTANSVRASEFSNRRSRPSSSQANSVTASASLPAVPTSSAILQQLSGPLRGNSKTEPQGALRAEDQAVGDDFVRQFSPGSVWIASTLSSLSPDSSKKSDKRRPMTVDPRSLCMAGTRSSLSPDYSIAKSRRRQIETKVVNAQLMEESLVSNKRRPMTVDTRSPWMAETLSPLSPDSTVAKSRRRQSETKDLNDPLTGAPWVSNKRRPMTVDTRSPWMAETPSSLGPDSSTAKSMRRQSETKDLNATLTEAPWVPNNRRPMTVDTCSLWMTETLSSLSPTSTTAKFKRRQSETKVLNDPLTGSSCVSNSTGDANKNDKRRPLTLDTCSLWMEENHSSLNPDPTSAQSRRGQSEAKVLTPPVAEAPSISTTNGDAKKSDKRSPKIVETCTHDWMDHEEEGAPEEQVAPKKHVLKDEEVGEGETDHIKGGPTVDEIFSRLAPNYHFLNHGDEGEADRIEGGPTVDEMFSRLESGSNGFDEPELMRMYTAFCRFKPSDSEAKRDDIPRLLTHLNYIILDESLVMNLAEDLLQHACIDFEDFEHFAMKYAAVEKEQLRAVYNEYDKRNMQQVPCSALPAIMKKLGLVTLETTIHHILPSLNMEETTMLTFGCFLKFIAAYRSRQGFMPSQISKLRKVFNALVAEGSLSTEPLLKASYLVIKDGLLRAFGANVHQSLEQLLEHTFWEASVRIPGITFHEFVVWAHRLQDMQISKLEKHFTSSDVDRNGLIFIEELFVAMKKAGFTLFQKTIVEILPEIDKTADTQLNLTDFVRFVSACQKRDGFDLKDLQSLAEAYEKHDPSNGMDNFKVAGLLRYLGYDIQLAEVHRYIKQVDFNGDGSMHFVEFLRLMRIHREEELQRLKKIFEGNCRTHPGKLDARDLKHSCEEAGFELEDKEGLLHSSRIQKSTLMVSRQTLPDLNNSVSKMPASTHHDDAAFEQAGSELDEQDDLESYDFEGFVQIVDELRERFITRKRQRAGFSDREFTLISNLWAKYCTNSKGKIDKGTIILLLIDTGIPMNQADERARVFDMLGEARHAAIKAGISSEDTGRPTSASLTFWPLVHLLRALLIIGERNTVMREDQAIFEAGFKIRQVADFRDIFLECGRWAAHGDAAFEQNVEDEHRVSHGLSLPSKSRATQMLTRRASLPDLGSKKSHSPTSRPHDWAAEAEIKSAPGLTLRDVLSGHVYLMRVTAQSIQVILSRKLGMTFDLKHREVLKQRATQISQQGFLDFADFIRLMKWILDTNFANINDVATTISETERNKTRESARQKIRRVSLLVKSTVRVKLALGRAFKKTSSL